MMIILCEAAYPMVFFFFYQDVLSRGILSGLVLFWNVYSVQPTPYNPQEVSVRLNLPKRLHVHN